MPCPARCIARESGAMNVYSIVPSQRSHATVSMRNSNRTPRYAQMTAPMSRLVITSLTSSSPPVASRREPPAGGREERLLERRGAVAALEVLRRLEREQTPAVEDADPLREAFGLVQVVGAEEDRRVVGRTDLADE